MDNAIKCSNCGADYGLHHYKTKQCPVNGREAPVGQNQEWQDQGFDGNHYIERLESDRTKLLEACKAVVNSGDYYFDRDEVPDEDNPIVVMSKTIKQIKAAITEAEQSAGS